MHQFLENENGNKIGINGRFPFTLQTLLENFYWEFPFGKGAFHLPQVPFEEAEGRLAVKRPRERHSHRFVALVIQFLIRKVWNW